MTSKEKLDAILLERLNSGDPTAMDDRYWTDLKQEVLAELESRKKSATKK